MGPNPVTAKKLAIPLLFLFQLRTNHTTYFRYFEPTPQQSSCKYLTINSISPVMRRKQRRLPCILLIPGGVWAVRGVRVLLHVPRQFVRMWHPYKYVQIIKCCRCFRSRTFCSPDPDAKARVTITNPDREFSRRIFLTVSKVEAQTSTALSKARYSVMNNKCKNCELKIVFVLRPTSPDRVWTQSGLPKSCGRRINLTPNNGIFTKILLGRGGMKPGGGGATTIITGGGGFSCCCCWARRCNHNKEYQNIFSV